MKIPSLETKGTLRIWVRNGAAFEEWPATVVQLFIRKKQPVLVLQVDAVAPDKKTFTRNILGRKLYFRLTKRRRWVLETRWTVRSTEPHDLITRPGDMHFAPGEQRFQDPFF